MKYLKNFESTITLDLDYYDRERVMEYALENNKPLIVKGLLDDKFSPNHIISDDSMLLYFYSNRGINLDMTKLLLDYKADVNLKVNGYPIIVSALYKYNKKMNINDYVELLRLFINAGANLFATTEYGDNFFDTLDSKLEYNKISKRSINLIMKMIKEESPEQYQEYIGRQTAIKYNL